MKIKNWVKEHKKEIGIGMLAFGAGMITVSGAGLLLMKRKPSGDLVYVINDAIDFITSKTGIAANTVADVLIAEEGYMRSVGIIAD